MSSYRVLVEFLRAQAKNRDEQAQIRLKDAHPNGQLIGKFRTEARHFEQAADLIASLEGPVTRTSEQAERERLTAPAVSEKPKNKGGRPPKMTAKQIAEAAKGPVAAKTHGASDDEAALAALARA